MRVKNAKQAALLNVREAVDRLNDTAGDDMGHFTYAEAAFFHAALEMLTRWCEAVEEKIFEEISDAQYERAAEDAERIANAREGFSE